MAHRVRLERRSQSAQARVALTLSGGGDLVERLQGVEGAGIADEPGADVEVAVGEYLVEGEVAEALDEFWVGLGQGRFPVRE